MYIVENVVCFGQTLSHQVGPVRDRLSLVEGERAEATQLKEEMEAVNRAEVDSLRAEESAIQSLTKEIMR